MHWHKNECIGIKNVCKPIYPKMYKLKVLGYEKVMLETEDRNRKL